MIENTLVTIKLPTGDLNFAQRGTVVVGNSQYLSGYIINLDVSYNMSLTGGNEPTRFTIDLRDDRRNILDALDIVPIFNREIEINLLENGSTFGEIKANIYAISSSSQGVIRLTGESRRQNFDENALKSIDPTIYPDATVQDVPIPIGMGDYDTGVGTLEAHLVDVDADKQFIYNQFTTDGTTIYPGTAVKVFEGETEVTGSVTLFEDTVVQDGVEYYRKFIKYPAATEETLTCTHETTTYIKPSDILRRLALYFGTDIATGWETDFDETARKRLYWIDKQTPSPTTPQPMTNFFSFGYVNETTAAEIFRHCFETFGAFYVFGEGNALTFKMLDYDSLTPDLMITESDPITSGFSWVADATKTENDFLHKYNRSNPGGRLTQQRKFPMPDKALSADSFGEFPREHQMEWITDRQTARNAAKHRAIFYSVPENTAQIQYHFSSQAALIFPGYIIEVKNRILPQRRRLYMAVGVNADVSGRTIQADLLDITHLETLDTDAKLIIHAFEPGTTNFWNDAPASDSEILAFGGISQVSSANSQIFGGVIDFNGSTQYLKIADPPGIADSLRLQAKKWDILTYTDYSISLWVTFDVLNLQQNIVNIYADINNRMQLVIGSSNNIFFTAIYSGINEVAIGTAVNAITDNDPHHIYFVKSGSDFGIYIDGVQKAYASSAYSAGLYGDLFFGVRGDMFGYFNGTLEEIRLGSDNIFNASPNAGLTDTIGGYTSQFTWRQPLADPTAGALLVDELDNFVVDENDDIIQT